MCSGAEALLLLSADVMGGLLQLLQNACMHALRTSLALRWRIAALSDGVQLQVARLECNAAGEVDRFRRMLALVRRAGES